MSKICDITGKRTISGNNVTRANNKIRRKFYPNLHTKKFFVQELEGWLRLKVSSTALRSINKYGIYEVLRKAKAKGTLARDLCYLVN